MSDIEVPEEAGFQAVEARIDLEAGVVLLEQAVQADPYREPQQRLVLVEDDDLRGVVDDKALGQEPGLVPFLVPHVFDLQKLFGRIVLEAQGVVDLVVRHLEVRVDLPAYRLDLFVGEPVLDLVRFHAAQDAPVLLEDEFLRVVQELADRLDAPVVEVVHLPDLDGGPAPLFHVFHHDAGLVRVVSLFVFAGAEPGKHRLHLEVKGRLQDVQGVPVLDHGVVIIVHVIEHDDVGVDMVAATGCLRGCSS